MFLFCFYNTLPKIKFIKRAKNGLKLEISPPPWCELRSTFLFFLFCFSHFDGNTAFQRSFTKSIFSKKIDSLKTKNRHVFVLIKHSLSNITYRFFFKPCNLFIFNCLQRFYFSNSDFLNT